jgi:hypothetical protein
LETNVGTTCSNIALLASPPHAENKHSDSQTQKTLDGFSDKFLQANWNDLTENGTKLLTVEKQLRFMNLLFKQVKVFKDSHDVAKLEDIKMNTEEKVNWFSEAPELVNSFQSYLNAALLELS